MPCEQRGMVLLVPNWSYPACPGLSPGMSMLGTVNQRPPSSEDVST